MIQVTGAGDVKSLPVLRSVPLRERRLLTAVGSHDFGLFDDVSLNGLLELLPGGARFQAKFAVESVEPEEVAVRLSRRRTGAAISDAPEVIPALASAVRQFVDLADVLGQTADWAGMS